MIKLEIKGDSLDETMKKLIDDQAPFAYSLAMNLAQKETNAKIKQEMVQGGIEGGPTRFTLHGLRNKWSRKGDLHSIIYFPENRSYMREIIYGGVKKARNKRLPEPILENIGGHITAKGNIKRSLYNSIRKGSKRYFVGVPRGFPNSPGNRGIWERIGKTGYKKGKPRGKIKQIVNLGRPQRQQRITFPADEIAIKQFKTGIAKNFPTAMKRAIESAKIKA